MTALQPNIVPKSQVHLKQRKADTPAQRVIEKFGSARKVAKAMQINVTTVYRWTYPRSKGGSDGLIPTEALRGVLMAARLEGIVLTPEELLP